VSVNGTGSWRQRQYIPSLLHRPLALHPIGEFVFYFGKTRFEIWPLKADQRKVDQRPFEV
jgi:hypothetical protein